MEIVQSIESSTSPVDEADTYQSCRIRSFTVKNDDPEPIDSMYITSHQPKISQEENRFTTTSQKNSEPTDGRKMYVP